MPLRPEVRKYYGAEHRAARLAAIAAAGGPYCSRCKRRDARVNLAHLNHDPRDRRYRTLLCPRCHALHDTPQRVAMTRRTRARRTGQLWLDGEIEYSAYPVRTWPAGLRQPRLF